MKSKKLLNELLNSSTDTYVLPSSFISKTPSSKKLSSPVNDDLESRVAKLEYMVNEHILKEILSLSKATDSLRRKSIEDLGSEKKTLKPSKSLKLLNTLNNLQSLNSNSQNFLNSSMVSTTAGEERKSIECRVVDIINEIFSEKLNDSSKFVTVHNNITNFFEDLLIDKMATQKKLMDKKLDSYIGELSSKFKALISDLNDKLSEFNSSTNKNFNNLTQDLKSISNSSVEKLTVSTALNEMKEWKSDIERTIEQITDKIMSINNVNYSRDNMMRTIDQKISDIESDLGRLTSGSARSGENEAAKLEGIKASKKAISQAITKNNTGIFYAIKLISEDIIKEFSEKLLSFEKLFLKMNNTFSKNSFNTYTYLIHSIKHHNKGLVKLSKSDYNVKEALSRISKVDRNIGEVYPQINTLNHKFDGLESSVKDLSRKTSAIDIKFEINESLKSKEKDITENKENIIEKLKIQIDASLKDKLETQEKLYNLRTNLLELVEVANSLKIKYEKLNLKVGEFEDEVPKKIELLKKETKNNLKDQENSFGSKIEEMSNKLLNVISSVESKFDEDLSQLSKTSEKKFKALEDSIFEVKSLQEFYKGEAENNLTKEHEKLKQLFEQEVSIINTQFIEFIQDFEENKKSIDLAKKEVVNLEDKITSLWGSFALQQELNASVSVSEKPSVPGNLSSGKSLSGKK